ncbi:hypothetical protein [Brevibacillus choshinensis]|uniref:hypothetical protein n=1 Tax=Brevibacillus choshinensis TaxID=54911 RepID=UPI002E1C4B4D|nr:hypothetical protein [Brevibacillus choshinensis]
MQNQIRASQEQLVLGMALIDYLKTNNSFGFWSSLCSESQGFIKGIFAEEEGVLEKIKSQEVTQQNFYLEPYVNIIVSAVREKVKEYLTDYAISNQVIVKDDLHVTLKLSPNIKTTVHYIAETVQDFFLVPLVYELDTREHGSWKIDYIRLYKQVV